MPSQAQPQYQSRIEQVDPDGANSVPLLQDAGYPAPAPDGARFAFVRSTDLGAAILTHSLLDGSDTELVAPGQFLALAYPRFSPDGQSVAFAAISLLSPVGHIASDTPFGLFRTRAAFAHGFPWEVWIVNADGTDLRQIPDVQDDDPSIAWSPDGSQLLIYGGWGSSSSTPELVRRRRCRSCRLRLDRLAARMTGSRQLGALQLLLRTTQ